MRQGPGCPGTYNATWYIASYTRPGRQKIPLTQALKAMCSGGREVLVGALAGVGAFATGLALYKGLQYVRSGNQTHDHDQDHSDEYMLKCFGTLHYAAPEDYLLYDCVPRHVVGFHEKCANLCIKHKKEGMVSRAMEVGCAAGRTSFELSRGFDSVLGVDISQAFVDKCNEIKRTGQTQYWLPGEGELGETRTTHLSSEIDRSRVEFRVGDGCDLPALSPGPLGCVITCNTLCRVPHPAKLLQQARDLLVPGGILVLVESYTWTEETTPKDKWLGGYRDREGKEVDTFVALKTVLSPDFELEEECVVQCVSRDAPRLFFWFLDHATVWRKRET